MKKLTLSKIFIQNISFISDIKIVFISDMIRLTVDEVPDKYTAYFISKYGINQEELQVVRDGHVFRIIGRFEKIISKFVS